MKLKRDHHQNETFKRKINYENRGIHSRVMDGCILKIYMQITLKPTLSTFGYK